MLFRSVVLLAVLASQAGIVVGMMQTTVSQQPAAMAVEERANLLIDRIAEPDEDGATHVGRVPWQADDVDGVTLVVQGGWARPGDLVWARIDANRDYDFRATALR